ncbi:uncharacterized protein LOC111043885 isoform X3 [Nilaparvata lugens]|uniref:uncharacterized protein LOC111043885 isoform X3 n=1 Tax=Nilaparvata lugens TaxID=108931 RepID=UPI00193E7B36|nr:uncharacterized protein LOC111043885 isoform X3 [Nilaparvata lugens]
MCAVVRDAQGFGSTLKLTQQQKGANYAYAIPDHRLGKKSQSTSSFAEQVEKQKTSNLSTIEPPQLRFCFQAIHLIQQAGAAIQKVADLTREESLQVLVNELEGATQKAFIYSEFSIGYSGEPLREAINATREATLAAHRVANTAYGTATKYASNPENSHIQEAVNSAQVAVQDAQRAVLAAQSAEQVLSAASQFQPSIPVFRK